MSVIKSSEPTFRGCAGAKYPHDAKCDRTLQAVQVVAGMKSVDVEVRLCYCNSDKCNEKPSSAPRTAAAAILSTVLSLITVYIISG